MIAAIYVFFVFVHLAIFCVIFITDEYENVYHYRFMDYMKAIGYSIIFPMTWSWILVELIRPDNKE